MAEKSKFCQNSQKTFLRAVCQSQNRPIKQTYFGQFYINLKFFALFLEKHSSIVYNIIGGKIMKKDEKKVDDLIVGDLAGIVGIIKSELVVTASANLNAQVLEELRVADPFILQARASLDENTEKEKE